MILRSLAVRRFKKFADWTAAFSPGLNVISGPNEAGKTTILEALFAALLTNPAQLPPGFAELVRPWGEKRLGESMLEFQVEGKGYLLRKDFEAGTALLQSLDRKERQENTHEIQRRMLGWLGLPSEAAVRSTASVGQGELARVTDERRLIGTQLSRILSGAGAEDVDSARLWLDGRLKTLKEGPLREAGAGEQLKGLLTQQLELERKETQWRALLDELGSVVQQLAVQEQQIHARSAHVTAAEQHATLRRREGDLERDLRRARDRLARLDALAERLSKNEATLNAFADQKNLKALHDFVRARRAMQNLQQALLIARQGLERGEATLEQLGERHHRTRRHKGMGLTLVGLGAATTTGGLLLTGLQSFPPGWGVVLGGAVLMLSGIRLRSQAAQTEAFYRDEEQRVLDMREKVEQARGHLQEAERKLQATVHALGASSIEAVVQRFPGYLDLVHQHDELHGAIRQTVDDQSREEIVARVQETERELQDVRQRFHQSRQVQPTAESAEPLEMQRLQKDANALRERKAWVEGMLEGLRSETDRRQVLEEQIAALRQQQARTRRAQEVLNLTRKMLEEARRQSHVPARELLERRAGEYFRLATDNRYEKVAVDEHTLMPRVWVAAAGGWKGPVGLSKGTVDQLYLALRLALLDVICQGRTPPVFLDEPFVHFDAERLHAVTPLIVNVARQRQVFLFTSRLQEDVSADQVIMLPRPTPAARGAPTA